MSELWKIRNTYLEPRKAMLLRKAAKLHTDPMIANRRLGVRSTIELTTAEVRHNHKQIEDLVKQGMIDVINPLGQDMTEEIRLGPSYIGEAKSEAPSGYVTANPDGTLSNVPVEMLEQESPEPAEAAPIPSTEQETRPEKVPEIMTPGPAAESPPLAPEQTAAKGKWKNRRS